MFNLSELSKSAVNYEPFTTAGAIFRETDRTNLYSQYKNRRFDVFGSLFKTRILRRKKNLNQDISKHSIITIICWNLIRSSEIISKFLIQKRLISKMIHIKTEKKRD